jgi:hypothetical protein
VRPQQQHEDMSDIIFYLVPAVQLKGELTGPFNSKVTASGLAWRIAFITVLPSPAPGMCQIA